ncbi:IS110 family transposase [Pseudogulbenkiania sp. MAI-1]|uniref:IS110 family transposase n=1 Tax=Pseudogulbenkiania sp. MAI-1 TaxID=990370 RepID=UPI00045E74A7|nr:IS110 family transposase [Pseudogulbenkiania sp. MAI-1]
MDIKTVGIDLAKDVITVCAMDPHGKVVDSRNLRFAALAEWLVQLPTGCIVGMEACSSAHHWARRMLALGLQPRLMAAEFVKPFRKSRRTKNDHNDAEAIAIAVQQPTMRFVTIKSEAQQARLAWHRLREGWKEERTALINRIRGLLLEFGYPLPRGNSALYLGLQVATQHQPLPLAFRRLLIRAQIQLKQLDEQLAACDRTIAESVRQDEDSQRLQQVGGVGPLTADAVPATVGKARDFKNGRQFAAWLGLTPIQFSSGGKTKLGRISRRGDSYLRTLLIQGAKSTLQGARKRAPDRLSRLERWIINLYGRVGYHKTLVAIANKHARQLWAMLAKEERYNPDAWQQRQTAS